MSVSCDYGSDLALAADQSDYGSPVANDHGCATTALRANGRLWIPTLRLELYAPFYLEYAQKVAKP